MLCLPEKLNQPIVNQANEGDIVAHFTVLNKLAKSKHEVKYTRTLIQV